MKLFTKYTLIITATMILPYSSLAKEPAKPVSVDTIQVLKISHQDQRAVIKTADGKMQIIKVGEVITSDQQSAISVQQSGQLR